MPITRKLIKVGKSSHAVVLPKSWVDFYEKRESQQIDEVAIKVNGELRTKPIFKGGK